MMRPFTLLCILLAGGSGLYVYQSKHQAQLLDREIARVVRQADAARERAGMLRAEYMLLNDPSRLETLSAEHLPGLKTTTPGQFTIWADMEKRLPPVGAPAVEAPPLEPEAPAAKLPEPAPEATKPIAAKPPTPAPAAPAPVVAAAAPRPAPPPSPPPRPASWTPRPATTPVSLTASLPSVAPPPVAARPLAAPQAAPVHAAPAAGAPSLLARPAPRAMPTYEPAGSPPAGAVTRVARGDPGEASAPQPVGSALGMARSLAPTPTPVARATPVGIWQPGGGGN